MELLVDERRTSFEALAASNDDMALGAIDALRRRNVRVPYSVAVVGFDDRRDSQSGEMDLIVLVAPFKTLDRIVAVIPLIGHILGGKLISIPFQAKGDLSNPQVIILPPTAVGANVLGILERTLKLPITIIQPVISAGKNAKGDQKQVDGK